MTDIITTAPEKVFVLENNYYVAAYNNEDGSALSGSNHLPLEAVICGGTGLFLTDGHHRLNERHEIAMPPLAINVRRQDCPPSGGNDDRYVSLQEIYRNYYETDAPPLIWQKFLSLTARVKKREKRIRGDYLKAGLKLAAGIEELCADRAVSQPSVFVWSRRRLPVFVWETDASFIFVFAFYQSLLIREEFKQSNPRKAAKPLHYHGNFDAGVLARIAAEREIYIQTDLTTASVKFNLLTEKF